MAWRMMSQREVDALLRLGEELNEGRTELPPEIQEIKRRIKDATKRAYLFMKKLNTIDYGMVFEVVALMRERDRLYAEWIEKES